MNDYSTQAADLHALKARLEAELHTIAIHNPLTDDWELSPDATIGQAADQNEQADAVEDSEERAAILNDLETRYRNVTRALQKITDGTYGRCELSGEPIEAARLAANPAARTCIAHREHEANLPL